MSREAFSRSARTSAVILFLSLTLIVGPQVAQAKKGKSDRSEKTSQAVSTSPIVLTPDGKELWVANEDHDTVTVLDVIKGAPYLKRQAEIRVGRRPRTIAMASDGRTLLVSDQHSSSLAVIDRAQRCVTQFVGTGWGSQPYGVLMAPDGRRAYVSCFAAAKVVQLDRGRQGRWSVGRNAETAKGPWAMALSANGGELYVTHLVNGGPYDSKDPALVTRLDTETFRSSHFRLQKDETPDTGGYVSMLRAIAIRPRGNTAVVVCQHIDSDRGMQRDKRASLSFKTEIQPVLCHLNLERIHESPGARIVLSKVGAVVNNPSAIAILEVGERLWYFVAAQGSEDLKVIEQRRSTTIERAIVRLGGKKAKWPSGAAPEGLCVDPARQRIYVLNLLNRSVSVVQIGDTAAEIRELEEVDLVRDEPLPPQVLRGKKVFYSSELGTSKDSWISCANCHPDAASDGRIWDFSQFGGSREPAARTLNLRAVTGYRGRLFWQGRADEVQDLEGGVRLLFGGQFIRGDVHPPLEKPNAGRSADFDAAAAYIASLRRVQPSPCRQEDGRLSEAALRGRRLFYETSSCSTCHRPDMRFCRSRRGDPSENVRGYDVGTGNTYNVPSLLEAWMGGPWLHDGRASNLREVLVRYNKDDRHGGTSALRAMEVSDLVAFVRSIDEGADVRSANGIDPRNTGPTAEEGHSRTRRPVAAGVPATFLGSRSFDLDGNIVDWRWSFDDGSPPIGARSTCGDVVHIFSQPGIFHATLKVTDDQGASHEKRWTVNVGAR